jgi:phenylpropionate dioxygenase-like ring-hydroxylating dioxygenase large terminal subunit
MEIFERDVELVRKPVEWASALPREAYLSQEWYDQELDKIFSRSWIWVCAADRLRNAGDFITSKIGDDPIVIVRANDGKLHGLINVCRHRGAQVVKGEGNMKSFVCPYHNWTYGLDGGLRGTPGLDWADMQGIEGFDSQKFGLHQFRVETWKGLVFANFDVNAEPLEKFLGEFGRVLAPFNFENLTRTKSIQADLKVNWKIFGDNMCEEYHIPYLHRDTLYKGVEERVVKSHDNSVGFYDKTESPKEDSGPRKEPVIEGMTHSDLRHLWFFYLFPSTLLFLTPYMMVVFNLIPTGLSSCSVYLEYYFPDPSKLSEEFKQRNYDLVERILFVEDIPVQETVQKGLLSKKGFALGDGRFSPKYEHGLHYFHNWVLDALQRP